MARAAALVAVAALVAAGCTGDSDDSAESASPLPTSSEVPGGLVRVGVWSEPDATLDTFAGHAVRMLTRPSLFQVQPDGSWAPSLVEPESVEERAGGTEVSFRLRTEARWSDGQPIDADDLRRTADEQFVAGVDGPDGDGRITVRLTHRVEGWQRLWSGADAVEPPSPDVAGGPFRLAGHTPGLEAVLVPNPGWWGASSPALDELRLVLVPDETTALELLERGELDVVAPMAVTALDRALEDIEGISWEAAPASGWWFGLEANPDVLRTDQRAGLFATVERVAFTEVLLDDEAGLVDSFVGAGTWQGDPNGDLRALRTRAETVITGYDEVPMSGLLLRSMQMRAREVGATLALRTARADLVAGWLAADDFEAALYLALDPPWPCWTCRFGDVDPAGAAAADGGNRGAAASLEALLRDDSILLPLWRPQVVVAWRDRVQGVEPNGFVPSAAWNADRWSLADDSDG